MCVPVRACVHINAMTTNSCSYRQFFLLFFLRKVPFTFDTQCCSWVMPISKLYIPCTLLKGPLNNYVDKMRGEWVKKSVLGKKFIQKTWAIVNLTENFFCHSQGKKTVPARGGGG